MGSPQRGRMGLWETLVTFLRTGLGVSPRSRLKMKQQEGIAHMYWEVLPTIVTIITGRVKEQIM